MTKRCEEYSKARHGLCGRPLDSHGNCDRASDHAEHLADHEHIPYLTKRGTFCAVCDRQLVMRK